MHIYLLDIQGRYCIHQLEFVDPQLEHRQLTTTLSAPNRVGGQPVQLVTTGFVANEDGPHAQRFAPGVGEHTDDVLREHGFDDHTIASLRDAGVLS